MQHPPCFQTAALAPLRAVGSSKRRRIESNSVRCRDEPHGRHASSKVRRELLLEGLSLAAAGSPSCSRTPSSGSLDINPWNNLLSDAGPSEEPWSHVAW
jgi:hypothetical protein